MRKRESWHIDRINNMKNPHPEVEVIVDSADSIVETNIETDYQGATIEVDNTENESNYEDKNQLMNGMPDISNQNKEPGVCPRCGAFLVKRNGKKRPIYWLYRISKMSVYHQIFPS